MATATAGSELTSYDKLLLRYRPRPITREAQYRRALKQIDGLMARDRLSPSEEDLLQLLAALTMQYEQARFPVPDVPPGRVLAHRGPRRNAGGGRPRDGNPAADDHPHHQRVAWNQRR